MTPGLMISAPASRMVWRPLGSRNRIPCVARTFSAVSIMVSTWSALSTSTGEYGLATSFHGSCRTAFATRFGRCLLLAMNFPCRLVLDPAPDAVAVINVTLTEQLTQDYLLRLDLHFGQHQHQNGQPEERRQRAQIDRPTE